MKKKLISFILAAFMLLSLAAPAFAASSPNEARDSVVMLYVYFEDTSGGSHYQCIPKDDVTTHIGGISSASDVKDLIRQAGTGTGFFVGKSGEDPKYLVTNFHVVDLYADCGQGELADIYDVSKGAYYRGRAKILAFFDDNEFEEVYVEEMDEKRDSCVLKLNNPTDKRKPLSLRSPDDSMVGSTVYAVGFPGISNNKLVAPTKMTGSSSASLKDGILGKIFTTQGSGRTDMEVTCDIQHGHSGGPVVTDDGAVIGVATYGVENENGEKNKYAVSIDESITLLNRCGADFETASSGGSDSGNAETAAATDENGSVVQDATQADDKQEQGDNTMMIIIIAAIAGVVIIGGVIVLVVVLSGKKNKQTQAQFAQQQAANQAPQVKTPYVRSLAMQHRGMRVKLMGANQILIGRSQADCAIVFQEGTPGVSGRHCSIAFDQASGDFILTDLGSTYGTFIQNGKKLTPGIAHHLRAGDRFYLGENGNMLTLELE